MRSARTLALLTSLAAVATGCVTFHRPSFATPPAERSWPSTLAAAKSDAVEGKFRHADSLLAAFALDYPASIPAVETGYWRAVLAMDPSNPDASLTRAIASLDSYIADPRERQHVAEAATLRRIANQVDSATKAVAAATAQAKDANAAAATARSQAKDANARAAEAKAEGAQAADAEIKRLKDELAKADAELERIRKRLGAPATKPPPGV